ncbi:ABCC2.2 family protein [Megaselia abdita]
MPHPMDDFCGSDFWDTSAAWEADTPEFTVCFEQTVLIWTPCAFLWALAILDVFYMKNSLSRNIPWNAFNGVKFLINVLLIVLSAVDLISAVARRNSGQEIFDVDIVTPIVKICTFFLAAVILFFNKRYGIQTSGVVFMFWLLLAIFSIPQCYSEVNNRPDRILHAERGDDTSWEDYKYISFMIYFSFVLASLVLNCFGDKQPLDTKYPRGKMECPENSASFLSRLTFSWFDGLAWRGYRNPLEEKDLWDLRPVDASKEVMPLFAKYWNKTVQKNKVDKTFVSPSAKFAKAENKVYFENPKSTKAKKDSSILPSICKSFGGVFLFGSFLKLINDLLMFASPEILKLIIQFVDSKFSDDETAPTPEPLWRGIFYSVLLFIVAGLQTFVLGQYFQRMMVVGLRIRTALINAIYRKALVISNTAKKESTVGEIVNLMAVDAQRFMDLTTYLNMIWSAPLQITLAIYFLWQILGASVLAGLAVMLLMIPINGWIANRIKILQVNQMKYKDERVKLMNEVLSGIKVLKLYAWEPSFEEQVLKIREKEIQTLRSAAYLNAGTSFLWSCAPFLVSLVTFATYVLVDEKNNLDAKTAFVSLSLFNILRFPLAMLPMLITNMVQTQVSVSRINKFMNSEELDPENVQHENKHAKTPIIIEDGTFSWGNDEVTIKNINIKAPKNSLIAIVGTVGSGKTSVISAMLGEMDKMKGYVNTVGKVAYVPQQAWIRNCTLRDNILFGLPYDRKKYNQVINACALKADIDILSSGDQTEIGEKGINLSGGQKQRISLARAAYSDADVYLFDDPLSAVDSHVGKHIFEEVIGPNGILSRKTKILVTHGIVFLPQVDNIYVMKDGEVSESGTYKELLDKKGAFSDFLMQHINEEEDEEGLEEIKQQLEKTSSSEEILGKLERAITKARTESLSDTSSIASQGSLRRRAKRQDSEISQISQKEEEKKAQEGKLIEAEKAQTGGVKWEVYKHYIKSIGIKLVAATIILNFAFQAFQIGSNLWLTKWSNDREVANNTGKRDMYLGVYGALGFGQAITVYFQFLLVSLGCLYSSKIMHNILMTYVMHWPMENFDTTPLGRVLNRFSKDVDTLDNVLPHLLRAFFSQAFAVLATIVVISISTPIFMAAILPIAILYYLAQRFYVATSRQLMRLESVSRSPIYSHFGETITGVSSIRAYHVQEEFIQENDDKVDRNQVCKYPNIVANRWLAIRLEMVGNLIILFSSLFAVLGGQDNPGLVGLSITYALQITQTLNWLVRMTSDIETNIVAVERIKEYGETKQEAPWVLENSKLSPNWPEQGRVQFTDFKVRYREGLDLVLRGISFDVNGGEKIGIVGRTGAGKSSLTLALFRIIESSGGRIFIDGIDISTLGLHNLRSRLTIIPQDPVLFSGSLRMNLDPFDSKTDDELWKALELAHLKTFVTSLTAGLNHEISEGGENLSVGQRQLVCLARALLRKTKVLILDEATAAVDLETDDLIQKTIRTEFKECTVLTIAHRLNTIMDSDRVIVLDKGEITEYASPSELLQNKSSAFYSMAKDANLVSDK